MASSSMAFTSTMSLAQQLLLHQTTTFSAGMAAVATSPSRMLVSTAAQSLAHVMLALPSTALLGKQCKNAPEAGRGDASSADLRAARAATAATATADNPSGLTCIAIFQSRLWRITVVHLVLFAEQSGITCDSRFEANGGVRVIFRSCQTGGCKRLDHANRCTIVANCRRRWCLRISTRCLPRFGVLSNCVIV